MSEFKLISEIIKISIGENWDSAKLEWKLVDVWETEEDETCLCGHHPIHELCIIENKYTQHNVTVGNCCVKKFMGIRSDKIFQAIKKIRRDIQKSVNAETIQYSFDKGYIDKWQKNFYLNTMRKRDLTEKQWTHRLNINKIILSEFEKSREIII
jgi:hypothetical protein